MTVSFDMGQRLGAGGFGEVYLAVMKSGASSQTVALKRIRADLAGTPDYLMQFEREAKICARLDHPHVVKLAAFGADDLGPYLALEYIHGKPASAFGPELARYGEQLPLDVGLSILRDAARGLVYAHQLQLGDRRGVIHRDISPDNVLVSYSGVAKLADFGIARAVDATRMTVTGGVKGKYGYMAPELFDGDEAGVPTDLFAFAVTIYQLLAGVSPFPARNEAELLRLVHECRPEPLSTHREVPDDVDDWVAATLRRDPAARPPSAVSILGVLDRHVHARTDEGRDDVRNCMKRLWPRQAGAPMPRIANAETKVREQPGSPVTAPARGRTAAPGSRLKSAGIAAVLAVCLAGAGTLAWALAQDDDPVKPRPFGDPTVVAPPPEGFAKLVADVEKKKEELEVKPPKPAMLTRIDVNVDSVPSGATVQLEGVKIPGRTPLVLEGLRPGITYHLDVHLPGWFAWSQTFVADGHDITAQLEAMPMKK